MYIYIYIYIASVQNKISTLISLYKAVYKDLGTASEQQMSL